LKGNGPKTGHKANITQPREAENRPSTPLRNPQWRDRAISAGSSKCPTDVDDSIEEYCIVYLDIIGFEQHQLY
jgi:hypothetical protein